MSESGSTSSESGFEDSDQEIKLHTPKGALEDIIKKAQQIATWYKKEDLIRVFKECFESESIFLNRLRIAAQNQAKQGDDDGWTFTGQKTKQQKASIKKVVKRDTDLDDKLAGYSFLKDQKLLKRIEAKQQPSTYKVHDNSEYREPRPKRDYKERKGGERERDRRDRSGQESGQIKGKRENKQFNYSKKYEEKRPEPVKYVPKQDHPQAKEKELTSGKSQAKTVYKEKDQKKPKIAEKPAVSKPNLQENGTPKPKLEATLPVQTLQTVVEKPKPQISTPKTEQAVNTNIASTVKRPKQQPKSQEPTSKPVPVIPKQHDSTWETQPLASTLPSVKVPDLNVGLQLSNPIIQAFQKACKENPYILSFIKPAGKLQKIEYIMDNKKFSNVKVRVISDMQ